MTFPHSTYRLQFRNGMDFASARTLVPYLARLGISHLYASPVMTSVSGSTHGYDVTDANEIDLALGGIDGLRQLADDLHKHGLGLILDIVPNHMAASLENPWWRSLVVWGEESPFSRHFDVDWSRQLTLPFLGKGFAEELADGTLRLGLDPRHDALALCYHESAYPLHPKTYELVLQGDIRPGKIDPKTDPQGSMVLGAALPAPGARAALEKHLEAVSADPARLAAIHAAQPWQLAGWRTASRHLSYRRFFEIAGLVGLRVEDAAVFADSHRLILDLVHDGTVDGLRIDHVDGLADPQAYLQRLRAAVGPNVYITVEKILERHEPLAAQWPVEGTTGYEFIASLADAFADERVSDRLTSAFQPLKHEEHRSDYAEEAKASKRQMLCDNFEGEVHRLAALAKSMADSTEADLSRSTVTEAIRAIIIALSVYRTYITSADITESDRQTLAQARQAAQESAQPEVREGIDFIWELLVDERIASALPDCAEFRSRFQQLSGPIMAKAMEDTLFYRENAFIALNEVGCDPGAPTGGPAAFHTAMLDRAKTMPLGLSATSTHDTKRGEDARARLYTLSEAPDRWIDAVQRWSDLNARFRRSHAGRRVPEPDVEWLIYQSLAGAWDGGSLGKRMALYLEKALREAKIGSSWSQPDTGYERKVLGFVEDILANDAFLRDFTESLTPFIDAGLMNALSQTLVKLTAPGVPDIYQGSERGDFSLVDPDNRPLLAAASLSVPERKAPSREHFADYKQWLIAMVLATRKAHPALFSGPYLPLACSYGDRHALAFLRGEPEAFAITIVPRLSLGRLQTDTLRLTETALHDLSFAIPNGFVGRKVTSMLDGRAMMLGNTVMLREVLASDPVALLIGSHERADGERPFTDPTKTGQ